MTKPHDETWTWAPQYQHIETPEGGDICIFLDDRVLDPSEKARLVLAAQAPAMARLLLKLEWVASATGRDRALTLCPSCGVSPDGRTSTGLRVRTPGEHAGDCELAAVLRQAGVLP